MWLTLRVVAVIGMLTILEARTVWLVHSAKMSRLVAESRGVTEGRPAWRTYQSRVLGPFAVMFVSRILQWPEARSYRLFGNVLMFTANLIAFIVGRRIFGGRWACWALVVINAAVFTWLQDFWIYPWDFISAITMLLFAYGIWAEAGLLFFITLFIVEILNRETAMFIALWLMFDGATRLMRREIQRGLERMLSGCALAVSGWLWTGFVRSHLFHSQTMPIAEDMVFDQLLMARVNVEGFLHFSSAYAVQWIGTIALVWGSLQVWRRRSRLAPAMSLLVIVMFSANFLFAKLVETRVWISVAPLLIPLLVPQDRRPRLPDDASAERV